MERNLYRSYSEYLKEKFGEKVYKLPINLPITCPNRENGSGGCSFCAELGTAFEAQENTLSVTEQLLENQKKIEQKYHAHKFIAYFQNYTNTWMELNDFQKYLLEAVQFPSVVGISISTRPDCIRSDYLQFLKELQKQYGIEITIELGLQTVNYHTLEKINRGHGLAAFLASVQLIHSYDFSIGVHLILNLPYDTIVDVKETVEIISALPVQIVKLHSLYIAKNTKLSYELEHGTISVCSAEEYIHRLVYFISHLRPDIVVERLFSRIPEEDSLFSNWGKSWWVLMDLWKEEMEQQELYQGKFYIPANEVAYELSYQAKILDGILIK